jgi:hypothetical protein
MTVSFMDMAWTINFRNGFGLDIEICDSRPVWILDAEGNLEFASFEGLSISIPLFIITIGNIWREV